MAQGFEQETMGERTDGERGENPGIVLGVLRAVERDSRVTQRSLSSELGIALGLTNAYLRRCAKKGLIKIRQIPLNRYAYYLTPRGFAEKSRLTAEYLTVSLNFFRRARHDCASLLQACTSQGWRRLVLFGAGDLAEIAIISASEAGVEVLSDVDAADHVRSCAGCIVFPSLAHAIRHAEGAVDAILVTDAKAPQESFDLAVAEAGASGIAPERVLAPALLYISTRGGSVSPGSSRKAARLARHLGTHADRGPRP